MKPHKHAELIKAWADGAEIQAKLEDGSWGDALNPCWFNHSEYRIKPEPKPDVVRYLNQLNHETYKPHKWEEDDYQITKNCIVITFDGETGELKSAEVFK